MHINFRIIVPFFTPKYGGVKSKVVLVYGTQENRDGSKQWGVYPVFLDYKSLPSHSPIPYIVPMPDNSLRGYFKLADSTYKTWTFVGYSLLVLIPIFAFYILLLLKEWFYDKKGKGK